MAIKPIKSKEYKPPVFREDKKIGMKSAAQKIFLQRSAFLHTLMLKKLRTVIPITMSAGKSWSIILSDFKSQQKIAITKAM